MSYIYIAPAGFTASSLDIGGKFYPIKSGYLNSEVDIFFILSPFGFLRADPETTLDHIDALEVARLKSIEDAKQAHLFEQQRLAEAEAAEIAAKAAAEAVEITDQAVAVAEAVEAAAAEAEAKKTRKTKE